MPFTPTHGFDYGCTGSRLSPRSAAIKQLCARSDPSQHHQPLQYETGEPGIGQYCGQRGDSNVDCVDLEKRHLAACVGSGLQERLTEIPHKPMASNARLGSRVSVDRRSARIRDTGLEESLYLPMSASQETTVFAEQFGPEGKRQ